GNRRSRFRFHQQATKRHYIWQIAERDPIPRGLLLRGQKSPAQVFAGECVAVGQGREIHYSAPKQDQSVRQWLSSREFQLLTTMRQVRLGDCPSRCKRPLALTAHPYCDRLLSKASSRSYTSLARSPGFCFPFRVPLALPPFFSQFLTAAFQS